MIRDKEYIRLMEKIFDESIEEEEVDLLRKKLEASPELLDDYLKSIDFHEDLKSYWAYQTDISLGIVEDQRDLLKLDRRQLKTRTRKISLQRFRNKRRSNLSLWMSAAACLIVLVGIQIYIGMRHPDKVEIMPDRAFYVLSEPGETMSVQDLLSGKQVSESIVHLKEELITVPQDRVAHIYLLNAKTKLELASGGKVGMKMSESGPRLHLHEGSMTSTIKKQEGSQVVYFDSTKLSAKILGTKIKMDAVGGDSFFSVTKGHVEVENLKTNKVLSLSENEAVAVAPGLKFEVKPSDEVLKARIPKMHGLQLWLDASQKSNFIFDKGRIKRWVDHSPRKRFARQDQSMYMPTLQKDAINGLSAIHFNARKGQHMLLGDIETDAKSSWTYFMVLKHAPKQKDTKVFGGQDGFHIGLSEGNYYYTEVSLGRKTIAARPGKVEVLSFVLDALNDQATVSKNGEIRDRHDDFDGERWLKARLSGDGIDDKYNYSGYIGEILVFNRALVGLERREIEAYLMNKWVLQKH